MLLSPRLTDMCARRCRLFVTVGLFATVILLQGCSAKIAAMKNLSCGKSTSDTITIQLKEEQVGVFQAVFQSEEERRQLRISGIDPNFARNPTAAGVQGLIASILGGTIDDLVLQGWGKTGRDTLDAIRRCSTFEDGGEVCAAKFNLDIKRFVIRELPGIVIERIRDRTVRRAARAVMVVVWLEKACTGSCVIERAYDKVSEGVRSRCAKSPVTGAVTQSSSAPRAYVLQREGHPGALVVGAGDANGDGFINSVDVKATQGGSVRCPLAVAAIAQGSAPGALVGCTEQDSLELEQIFLYFVRGSSSGAATSSSESASSSERAGGEQTSSSSHGATTSLSSDSSASMGSSSNSVE